MNINYFMDLAKKEAKKAYLLNEIPVGAILVDNNSKTCKKINDEFAKLNIKNYNLICDNVLKFIKN